MSIRDTAATTPQTRVASSCQGKNAACSAASNASSDDAPRSRRLLDICKEHGPLGVVNSKDAAALAPQSCPEPADISPAADPPGCEMTFYGCSPCQSSTS